MSSSHRPHIHRNDISHFHGAPEKAISIDEYIEIARSGICAADVRRLTGSRSQMEIKLQSEQARQHSNLREGAQILFRFLTSPQALESADPLPSDVAEAAVGLNYLLDDIDIIPDSLPEIGMTDDARLVARVLARNPSILP